MSPVPTQLFKNCLAGRVAQQFFGRPGNVVSPSGSQQAKLSLGGRVVGRLVAHVGLTSALPDQGIIGAFLHGWFLKVLCSQGVGRSMPLAGKLCVSPGEMDNEGNKDCAAI